MDRIDAMRIFVTALDEGSLAGASRALKRSPASISRAIAFLETQVGVELLHRTTRSMRLSDAGARYAEACRRILAELEEADLAVSSERAAPRGILTISAPPVAGDDVLRPIIEKFLAVHPAVSIRLVLVDRPVNLIDEGVDVAFRIAQLPDSSLIATRIGGDIRRVVVAAPAYLAAHGPIREPSDLAHHQIIAFTNFGLDSWTFAPTPSSRVPRSVRFAPRLSVNTVPAALGSAIAGVGVTRLYSYHVAHAVREGRLEVLLSNAEFPALPVHLLTPPGHLLVPKVRAFVDFAAPRLRAAFGRLAVEATSLT
jgi:DNA-binding transcriptional LysR family regulator